MANISWAMAKLGLLHQTLMTAISAASRARITDFEQQNLANMAWSFASLAIADLPLLASIAAAALPSIRDWGSQSLANLVWSCALLDLANSPLLAAIAAESIATMNEFKRQELVNTAWAFATLSGADVPLLKAISAAAIKKLTDFVPHDLAGLAWSFAVIAFGDSPLMESIAAPSIANLPDFRPQDLANIAWSFANLGFRNEPLLAAISSASLPNITDFQPQDLGNTFWAFAKLEIHPGDPLKDAIAAAALRRLAQLAPQNLAMIAWAFSTLGIVHEPLMESIAAAAINRLDEFATHDLANLLWSYPSLELDVERVFLARVQDVVVDRIPVECAGVLEEMTESPIATQLVVQVSEFTNLLLEFAWSFSFSGEAAPEVMDVLRSSLMAVAKLLDKRCPWRTLSSPNLRAAPYGMGSDWGGEVPRIVLDLECIVAVLKPPHWEVDARAGGSIPGESCGAPLFSSFLRWTFPSSTCPLMHCNGQQFGIIHRLDAPSSGLILAGKNFVGYYTLRWQQDTYELGREYLVLCHGRMSWEPQVINVKIKAPKAFHANSQVSEEGRPAWTRVQPLCILRRGGSLEECYSLVAITIRTGRTHQIRVHLKHIGHPSVTDGKYTSQLLYNSDRAWCPRNFLHRHRLTFQDTEGTLREAVAPLPADLLAVLQRMIPADGRSAEILKMVLKGWVPKNACE